MPEFTWRDAIVQVLRDSGEPMHYSAIAEAIASARLLTGRVGATPSATVSSVITVSLQAEGDASPFIRTSRGMYALREAETAAVERLPAADLDGEPEEGAALINAFGMYWRRDKVMWRQNSARLLGQQQTNSAPVDFAGQKGVYLLFDGREVIYVGRATDGTLGNRLAVHTRDRLNTRWDRFSWFGIYPVREDGTLLVTNPEGMEPGTLLATMEALLIEALEPPQNRQRGEDFKAREFIQYEDPELQQERLRREIGQLVNQAGNAR